MHRLDEPAEKHFAEADYAGSEVLIYRWNSGSGQLLLCCLDLSNQIAHWAYGTDPPSYASRYRVIRFLNVARYHRFGADPSWQGVQDDFLITRADRRLPIDNISVTAADDTLAVALAFERGFGGTKFRCREVMISALETRDEPISDGASRRLVDADSGDPLNEDQFLTDLYESLN